jgi:hypothetical protein
MVPVEAMPSLHSAAPRQWPQRVCPVAEVGLEAKQEDHPDQGAGEFKGYLGHLHHDEW